MVGNSVISFVELLLKLVFYLFVFVLFNNTFGTSVVANDRNRRMIVFVTVISVKMGTYFLYLSSKRLDLQSIISRFSCLDRLLFLCSHFVPHREHTLSQL